MHSRTVEQVRSWDSRPFSGGLEALSTLSDNGHTGAVVADDTWLFMLNGRVIGVFEGSIEDFSASGTVYSTAHDGLALLFSMQEREGRTRAKYFTEDTPLREADQTLTDANFTGYIELSENVLSGDYYLVYYGGTRRSVAFVGQSERVETAEEAFELAAEEVGLYEVKDVSMTITEIPDTGPRNQETPDEDAEAAVATTSSNSDTIVEDRDDSSPESETEDFSNTDVASDSGEATRKAEATDTADGTDAERNENSVASTAPPESTSTESPTSAVDRQAESQHPSGTDESESETTASESDTGAEATHGTGSESVGTPKDEPAPDQEPAARDSDSTASAELERRFQEEAEWRQTRAIPALSPEETESTDLSASRTETTAQKAAGESKSESKSGQSTVTESPTSSSSSKAGGTYRGSGSQTLAERHRSSPEQGGANPRMEKLQTALVEREERIESLETRLSESESARAELETELEGEREKHKQLEADLAELREERDRLADRIESLEESETVGTKAGTTTQMEPAEALSGTNLFVRYESKGAPTLESLGEEVDPAAVNDNLTLEHHTQFETDSVQIDGQDYRAFLEQTGAFQFVSWVLRELPYELLETGKRSSMPELFEAISAVDRIELDGSVTVDSEDSTAVTFTLVMRDRMGNPLIVGDYDEGRNPVTEDQLAGLLDGAKKVAGEAEQMVGAFYVSASFFDPGALELAENAASSGGLFSRQEKASYVTADSGSGFHLGLIEDRSQTFHVTVPKL